jgi:hypothetical protein
MLKMVTAATLLLVGTSAAYADQKRNVVRTQEQLVGCTSGAEQAELARVIAAGINARVSALPADRQSVQDIEAAIVYEISQHKYCPGAARAALASLSGGSGAFGQAVARVSSTLLPATSGTAGISGGSAANGGSFFTSPIVGLGGGSANYSQ